MHAGFVGMGMLDAACPGEVFTSPLIKCWQLPKDGRWSWHPLHRQELQWRCDELGQPELARTEGIRVLNILIDVMWR